MKLHEIVEAPAKEDPTRGSSITIKRDGEKHIVTVMDEVSGRVYRQELGPDWQDPDFHLGAVEA